MPAPPSSGEIEPGAGDRAFVCRTLKFRRGDTFYDLARRLGLSAGTAANLIRAARNQLDVHQIRPGDTITLKTEKENPSHFVLEYEKKDTYRVIAEAEGGGFRVEKRWISLTPRVRIAEGTIESSLYQSAVRAGVSPLLVERLAGIFCWDVDFLVDIRPGDRFRIVYVEWLRGNRRVRDGVILAARFVNQGRILDAFWFQSEGGKEGYFDAQGRNVRKQFLKSPLKYRRISSYFSRRRFHPILKIWRPHLGVDYAAPRGTPVQCIGDGKVLFAGWKNGFGRFVKIRHPNGLVSCYGHLCRIASRIRRGRYVEQGQLVGWVGQTGLATGPHLDFRIIRHGKYVNPLIVLRRSPSLDAVDPRHRRAFLRTVRTYLPYLEGAPPLKATARLSPAHLNH